MQRTIDQPVPAVGKRALPTSSTGNRRWPSIAAVAVLGAAIGLGLSTLSSGPTTPQEIADLRAEQMVEYHAGQWAIQNALTPQDIAALRYSQYPEAHHRIWQSQQP